MSDTRPNLPEPAIRALDAGLEKLPAMSVDDVIERSLAATLNAGTVDDVLADPESRGLRDLAGRVVTLHGILGALPSSKKGPLNRYVVLDVEDEATGERGAASTGSLYVVARALRLLELDAYPVKVRVVELESTANPGQSSLWITKA